MSEVSFAQFGKQFQEKLVQAMLVDPEWSARMSEVIDTDYFDLKYLKFLADRYFSYYEKYKTFPIFSTLVIIAKDELKAESDSTLKTQVIDFLQRTRTGADTSDFDYIKDKSLDFCRKQSLRIALEASVDLINGEQYEKVPDLIKNALIAGTTPSLGLEFFDDMETRFKRTNRCPVPTGIPALDHKDVLNGGLGKGELGVVVANTGVGKSHLLVQFGAAAMAAGKNVLHYTMELSESIVGIRYDSNICRIPSSDVYDRRDDVVKHYENNEMGRLIIKYYPTKSATINTIRAHIEKAMLKGINPGLIIIDYADVMRSTKQYDSMRHELQHVYEEVRNLAGEMTVPIWTASQAHRDSADSDVVGLENMSEAYGKAMTADVVISLSRKPLEKSKGIGRMFVAKNRAGRDGLIYPCKIDTSMSLIETLDDVDEGTLEQIRSNDTKAIKRELREKWEALTKNT